MDIKAALHQESNHTVQCNVDISTVSTAFLNFDSSECFWASGRGVGDILTSRSSHKILSSKNRARMKDRLMCWCPLFFSVTSSSSFHVWMSRCLPVPEMTTSLTLWVRRLTARPAAATPERTDALEKTWPHPLTRGSLRPTSQGWCGQSKFRFPVTFEIIPFHPIHVMIITLNMIEISWDWTDLHSNDAGNILLSVTFYKYLFLFFSANPCLGPTCLHQVIFNEARLDCICIFRDHSLVEA